MATTTILTAVATPVPSPITTRGVETTVVTTTRGIVSSSGESTIIVRTTTGEFESSTPIASAGLSCYIANGNGMSAGEIAGMVIGMLAGIALLGLLAFWFLFMRNRRQRAETRAKVARIMEDRERQGPTPEVAVVPAATNSPEPMGGVIREVADPKPNGPPPFNKDEKFLHARASNVSTVVMSPIPASPDLVPESDPFIGESENEPARRSSRFSEDASAMKISRR